ncbi:MAG: S8 family serine peptidase [Rubrivivax sp.]|nr:S8 family serine peptidase [Rubrivivax sp.]
MPPNRPVAAATVAASLLLAGTPLAAQTPPPAAAKTVIEKAEDLPRRSYALQRLPSEWLAAPLPELLAVLRPLEADLLADEQAFDIRDPATRRQRLGALLAIAQLRGDWDAAARLAAQIRPLNDKAGPRAISGLVPQLVAEHRRGVLDTAGVQRAAAERFGALPWAEAGDAIKGLKSQLELLNPALVQGVFRQQADVMARNMALQVPAELVATLAQARAQADYVVPLRDALVAGLQQVVERHAVAKPDRWTPRQVMLPAHAKGTPVTVAIWDSGVDLALFTPAAQRGWAFDDDGIESPHLLRPLGEAQARWPQLRGFVKGAFDLRAGLDTEESRRLRTHVAGLQAEQATAFQEDTALAGLYVHGTHVAGIAAAGNPFVRVQAVSMLWSHRVAPTKPTLERARVNAANYQGIVDRLKAAGTRVVNMSWRYGPQAHEAALAYHGVGRDADERRRLAAEIFAIERQALERAIASAPEILFVAGAGNEDNSADFADYIPAGLQLPNLITVGASDQAGDEAPFSTFGRTVVVHANGAEVDGPLPGGTRARLSGTSMASPQVANLAAKLIAMKPQLTVAEVKAAILNGAERRGRVNLVDPRRSFALAGIALPD